jgi:transposase
MNALATCKTSLKALTEQCSAQFNSQIERVMTVPGIQRSSAISIISEIGVDMSVFPTAKHLCSWAGLTPQNDQSTGKKKTTRISRSGTYIKLLLVQCFLAAITSKSIRKSKGDIHAEKTPWTQESNYRHFQDAFDHNQRNPQKSRTL